MNDVDKSFEPENVFLYPPYPPHKCPRCDVLEKFNEYLIEANTQLRGQALINSSRSESLLHAMTAKIANKMLSLKDDSFSIDEASQ